MIFFNHSPSPAPSHYPPPPFPNSSPPSFFEAKTFLLIRVDAEKPQIIALPLSALLHCGTGLQTALCVPYIHMFVCLKR